MIRLGYLHENIGTNYISVMVIPNVRSSVRAVTGRYTAEEIYSTKRGEVEAEIIEATRKALAQKNIEMKDLLIRSITLPEKIKAAIESKLQQQQEALAYQYRLEREKSEADRLRIQAQGIADYNALSVHHLQIAYYSRRVLMPLWLLPIQPTLRLWLLEVVKTGFL